MVTNDPNNGRSRGIESGNVENGFVNGSVVRLCSIFLRFTYFTLPRVLKHLKFNKCSA